MFYLLSASWQWFAAAALVGLAVGWLTTTRERGEAPAGRGAIAAGLLALGAGFVIANLHLAPGRAGLLLEIALLLLAAYGLGLPLGGGAKLLLAGPAPAPAPVKRKPPPVVLRGKAAESAPVPTESEAPPPPIAPLAPPEPALAAPPPRPESLRLVRVRPEAKAPAAKEEGGKKLPGAQPKGLPGPRGGGGDDLSKIKGVGPKSVEKLHSLGVYHFDQIAAWTPENVKWIGASLAIPGRVERGKWIAQARELADAAQEATQRDDVSAPAQ